MLVTRQSSDEGEAGGYSWMLQDSGSYGGIEERLSKLECLTEGLKCFVHSECN